MNYQKQLKAISTKGLTKENGYKILNGSMYFYSGIFQNYLVFVAAKECIKFSRGTTRIYPWKSNTNVRIEY